MEFHNGVQQGEFKESGERARTEEKPSMFDHIALKQH